MSENQFCVYMAKIEDLPSLWPQALPYIEKAVEGDSIRELMEIKSAINNGEMTLFKVWNRDDPNQDPLCWIVTEMYITGGVKTLCIQYLCGKNMDEWLPGIGIFDAMAKGLNCRRLEVCGRKGWEKKLKRFGFKHAYTVLSLDLRERMN